MPGRTALLILTILLPTACGGSTGPDLSGACLPSVRARRVLYALSISDGVTRDQVQDSVYAEVRMHVDNCDDTSAAYDPADGLQDGESNFLPVGTALHPIRGTPPTERLAVFRGDEWRVVVMEP